MIKKKKKLFYTNMYFENLINQINDSKYIK